eukprot:6208696-Pleurochrysis_carterae.AAC.3
MRHADANLSPKKPDIFLSRAVCCSDDLDGSQLKSAEHLLQIIAHACSRGRIHGVRFSTHNVRELLRERKRASQAKQAATVTCLLEH